MVERRQNLIVETQHGTRKLKAPWQNHQPLRLDIPNGWTLRQLEGAYELRFNRRPSLLPIVFGAAEAQTGVEIPMPKLSEGTFTIRIYPLVSRFHSWITSPPPQAVTDGQGLMVLRGQGNRLLWNQVSTSQFKSSAFTFNKYRHEWKLTETHRELRIFQGEKEVPRLAAMNKSLEELTQLTFRSGENWWKIRSVALNRVGSRWEVPQRLAAYALGAWIAVAALTLAPIALQKTEPTESAKGAEYAIVTITRKSAPIAARPPTPVQTDGIPSTGAASVPAVEQAKSESEPQFKVSPPATDSTPRLMPDRAPKKAARFAQAQWLRSQMNGFESTRPKPGPSSEETQEVQTSLSLAMPGLPQTPAGTRAVSTEALRDLTIPTVKTPAPPSEEDDVKRVFQAARLQIGPDDERDPYAVSGGLTPAQIEQAVSRQITAVRDCYDQMLTRESGRSGRIVLHFVVGKTGHIDVARITDSSLPDVGLQKCVLREVKNWKFPVPSGGVQASVSYPFVFKPVGVN